MVTSSQELILSLLPAAFTVQLTIRELGEINHDDIRVDVHALSINANGHIFAGLDAGGTAGSIFRSTDDSDS